MRVLLWLLPMSVACSTMPASTFQRRLTVIDCQALDRCGQVSTELCIEATPLAEDLDGDCAVDARAAHRCFSAVRQRGCSEFLEPEDVCSSVIAECRDAFVP